MDFGKIIAKEFALDEKHAENIITLIDEGNTLPFIARYRKEQTGAIDDQVLFDVFERLSYLRGLEARKAEITAAIEAQGKMTDEIAAALAAADTLVRAEDIYRPFKQKKQTRGGIARKAGLEPLAKLILESADYTAELTECAGRLEKSEDEVISGALDIIAEDLSDDAALRDILRGRLEKEAQIVSKVKKEEEKSVYEMYYDYAESCAKIPAHRILAVNRGEAEGILKVSIECDDDALKEEILNHIGFSAKKHKELIRNAAYDAYSRLIFPSLERELRAALSDRAADSAIKAFGENLKPLLMQRPLAGTVVMGLDPGYRTGCKLAVVSELGDVLTTGVIYITHGEAQKAQAAKTVKEIIAKHKVSAIAIGNGTASRETADFAAEVIKGVNGIAFTIVNEAGASVYSASKIAAAEFPQFDLTVRSAISIARRLQDPLSELVKIEPKSIGVGQYQHDMPKARLASALSAVVESCVNSVGVDINTASASLLSYVAGISGTLAENIIAYRAENGKFKNRKELKKVKKLGDKAFLQCAGFLRIKESKNLLDNTAVHPESYAVAENLLKKLSAQPGSADEINGKIKEFGGTKKLSEELGCGEQTLADIISELKKPGRDPREDLPPVVLRQDVLSIENLKEGMELSGTIRNVIDFGAFVDIGVHEDGLVHISQLCDRYIKHPSEVVKTGDIVKVRVLSVDLERKRISLSMR